MENVVDISDFTFNPKGIPQELKEYNQWVVWKLEKTEKKTLKKPLVKGLTGMGWQHKKNQMSFDEAYQLFKDNRNILSGVGFVFSADDPFVFIDIDKVKENDERLALIPKDTWSEVSQSGRGYHVVVKGYLSSSFKENGIEVYDSGRFCAMTGRLAEGFNCLEITKNQNLIDQISGEENIADLMEVVNDSGKFKLPEKVRDGDGRESLMLSYCVSLAVRGATLDEIQDKAIDVNRNRFEPELDWDIVNDRVQRAFDRDWETQ